ncbi:tRNA glutamyl-Q(34) synthetase GluQRS [Tessaracoccus rhinocerotis]|uniref:tRNA glutamyl-Q(34) synthetase GluQRS n=1 Tax=Tessaracoccus rhinocerotis TaxID=1689449 RepID=UPI001FE46392|nr:tRNA glutamyl-Q(34) synthetase GluQRS [Tessaracoccus rhinocerotis]
MSVTDRYAPSPTAQLHLGNLRTALAGWLLTRRSGGRWLMRVEDLDEARVRAAEGVAEQQLEDLRGLGLDWDGDVVWQSQRLEAYATAVAALSGRTYECFCTRREIAEASSAPHDDGHRPYPGTCARLSSAEAARRREDRPAAIRVRAEGAAFTVTDLQLGEVTGLVDDFVLVRGDGAYSYNLAVTVDDLAQGVTQVTRGADLLSSSPRQAWLATQLGGTPPRYAHVGLVTNPDGARLAKRDGSVTLADLAERRWDSRRVLSALTASLGLGPQETTTAALEAMPEDGLPPAGGAFWLGAVWDDTEGVLRGQ